jgi:hypothetical protein
MLMVAFTMLNLMDLGPQPWLGILLLTLSWSFRLIYNEQDRNSSTAIWPEGIFDWLAARLTLIHLILDVYKQWTNRYGLKAHQRNQSGRLV